jgi:CDP-4-dehydro-6-deoxyglucose reductase, E3
MARILFEGKGFELARGETVLDGLLREGFSLPHSCRAGVCQSCLVRADSGAVPQESQGGLKETLKAQGYFLPCICRPESALEISRAGEALDVAASLEELDRLNRTVMRVRIRPAARLSYIPGQFITLLRGDGVARSFSLASLASDELLELHIRKVSGGKMSSWLHEEASPGDRVTLRGAFGNCFYTEGRPDQPLLLAGTGTGLAPLYGIARDALSKGHDGRMDLYHAGRAPEDLYLTEELLDLQQRHSNFVYHPVVESGSSPGIEARAGSIEEIVLGDFPQPKGMRTYICGRPAMVKTLRKKLFLAGQSLRDIFGDAFLPSGNGS